MILPDPHAPAVAQPYENVDSAEPDSLLMIPILSPTPGTLDISCLVIVQCVFISKVTAEQPTANMHQTSSFSLAIYALIPSV